MQPFSDWPTRLLLTIFTTTSLSFDNNNNNKHNKIVDSIVTLTTTNTECSNSPTDSLCDSFTSANMDHHSPSGRSPSARRLRINTRPVSSTSASSKMTPTSSEPTSSTRSLQLQLRHPGPSSGSSLLQDRLRERKGDQARLGRHGQSMDMTEDRQVQSSPVRGLCSRDERRPSSSSGKMGVKQMEDVRTSWNSTGRERC